MSEKEYIFLKYFLKNVFVFVCLFFDNSGKVAKSVVTQCSLPTIPKSLF